MNSVGIVTWYWGNYGSILQALAMQMAVQEMGYDCEIIQHHVNGTKKEQLNYRIKHDGLVKTTGYIIQRLKAHVNPKEEMALIQRRQNSFNSFIDENLNISIKTFQNDSYRDCTQYQTYICGSDQIWNPNFTFLSPFYWLSFLPNEKNLIAYAPSMGNGRLMKQDEDIIRGYLQKLDYVSVREEKSAEILRRIAPEKNIQTVCDPTILIRAEQWKSFIKEMPTTERYLFAYIIRGNKDQRLYVREIANQFGLQLVVYPYLEGNAIEDDELNWGDIRIFEDTPFDFLTRIYNAAMVITDSFHCSVFSMLFHKNFYVIKKFNDTTSQFTRLENLLTICKQKNRIISTGDIICYLNDDYLECDKAIEDIRTTSKLFLERALSGVEEQR